MKKMIKWMAILMGAMVVIVVAAIAIVPKFVNLQKYRPLLEKTVQEKTGRPFALNGDIELSLFPWAGVTLNGVSLGNPDGFEGDGFASFTEFEIRMKLLPLISKEIEVKHIVLKGLKLILERKTDGAVNWDFGSTPTQPVEKDKSNDASMEENNDGDTPQSLPIKNLSVGEISVIDGSILYVDQETNVRKELTDVTVRLTEISLDAPLNILFSGKLDGENLSLEGLVGPFGENPGEGDIGIDFEAELFNILNIDLNGTITAPATAPAYNIMVTIDSFSPRQLLQHVAPEMEIMSSDPTVLGKFSFAVRISGDTQKVVLTEGKVVLDDTITELEMTAKEFSKPDVQWNIHVDKIDIDRYLSEKEDKKTGQAGGGTATGQGSEAAQIDYAPLRKIVLDGSVNIDELKAGGGSFQNIRMEISAKNGKFLVEPFSMDLYDGKLVVNSTVDVTGNKPETAVSLDAEGVEIEPLLKEFADKNFISGTTGADISLTMVGDNVSQIKESLDGNGKIIFEDGKVRNVNLIGMINNLDEAFLSGNMDIEEETEFSEFKSSFKITNGVFKTTDTELSSPVLRVNVDGTADLVSETIDFRIEPTYINPKNQKESGVSISGNKVPVLVTGTFSDPKFKPDLETAAKNIVTEKLTEKLGEVLGGSISKENGKSAAEDSEQSSTVEDTVKGLLNNIKIGK
jgi:AsmA protein